jgi:hypothetical protein
VRKYSRLRNGNVDEMQETDARDFRWLLRSRCERLRRCATQNAKKFPPPHARPLAQETASYRLKRVL